MILVLLHSLMDIAKASETVKCSLMLKLFFLFFVFCFFLFFLFIQNNKLQTQIQLQTWTDKKKNIEQDRTHWDAKNVCHTLKLLLAQQLMKFKKRAIPLKEYINNIL